MKIAILSFYSGSLERGAENWAMQLADHLKPKIVTQIFQGNPGEKLISFTVRSLSQLQGFDVVIPVNGRWQVVLTRLYCWVKGKKMMVVGHSGRGFDDRINLYCFPDVFVGLSQYACDWAQKINPLVKVVHIPNGVDLAKFSPTGKKVKINLNPPIILAIGAFERGKQLDLVIKAVAKTSFSLVILGDGALNDSLTKLAKELMPGRYLITKVPFTEVPDYCRAANLFTLTSWRWESYPLVYLEAMACNLPVVATDDPVRHEIVDNAGLFVNPADAESFAKTLNTAVRTKWGNLPRLQAEKFAWEIIAQQYEKILVSL